MTPKDFTSFDKMITPTIIQILFWIGVVLAVLMGLFQIVSGLFLSQGGLVVLIGLISIVLGPLAVRIYCEILILGFRIHDNSVAIRRALEGGQSSTPPPPV